MKKIFFLFILLVSSCSPVPKDEDKEYLFPINSGNFVLQSYRVIDQGVWQNVSGQATVSFSLLEDEFSTGEQELTMSFSNYSDIGGTCNGSFRAIVEDIESIEVAQAGSSDYWSVFDPYEPDFVTPVIDTNTDIETKNIFARMIALSPTQFGQILGPLCPFVVLESNNWIIQLYYNGDLIIKDYGRGYDFYARPQ